MDRTAGFLVDVPLDDGSSLAARLVEVVDVATPVELVSCLVGMPHLALGEETDLRKMMNGGAFRGGRYKGGSEVARRPLHPVRGMAVDIRSEGCD